VAQDLDDLREAIGASHGMLTPLVGMAAAGPPGLVAAAFPALLGVTVALALLVPRFVERATRQILGHRRRPRR
jgi:hypothetical protein